MRQFIHLIAIFSLLLTCSCANQALMIRRDAPADPVLVVEVKNFAGVPLIVPAVYFGDSLGTAESLEVEKLDLLQLSRAALFAQMRDRGYLASLSEDAKGARFEIHAAMTCFDLDSVKDNGRIKLGMLVIVVDGRTNAESARGEVTREFQLFNRAPNDGGSLGESRFIEARLKGFVEALASDTLSAAGVQ